MKELWKRTFELFRRHFVLWVPSSIAGILMLGLGRLPKAEIHWLFGFFGTQHSALGGIEPSTDLAQAQNRAMMVIYPQVLLKQLLEVCFFVVALIMTKSLVNMILEEQRPNMVAAMRGIAPRSREVLLFSLKYMAVLALFSGVSIILASSPLTPERFHELASSKVSIYVFGLVVEGCLAWLLVPAAIRLLRPPGSPMMSTQDRVAGTVFAVATSAVSLALEFLVGRAEATIMLDKKWEGEAIAVVNTIIVNVPQVLLFIALALMALQVPGEETSLTAQLDMSWSNRFSDWVRRAREWRGDSF